jgi:hypothetical protein
MSKKYKGKTCTYCTVPKSSTTGDHVVAREFFPLDKRANLPKVPACGRCNVAKSKLEHYLTAVMPFGSNTPDGRRVMMELVADRLRNNLALTRHLVEGARIKPISPDGGRSWQEQHTLPFDSSKLVQLLRLIGKGMAFTHWGVLLPDRDVVLYGDFLVSAGATGMEMLLASKRANSTGKIVLGDGVFTYEGIQDPDWPTFTVWRMALYGGTYDGDQNAPHEQVSSAYVMSAPRGLKAATDLIHSLRRPRNGEPPDRAA